MSKIIATAAIRGAHKYVSEAEAKLKEAIETYKPEKKVAFPNTAYNLPLILALLGLKVETLKDCREALGHAKALLPPPPTDGLWLPYLGDALDAGVATLIAEEIIEALKYLDPSYKPEPPWLGFTDDAILRTQGIKLVDGRMPGFAACVGALPTNRDAVELARGLQERNILVFMAGDSNGRSMAEQLAEEDIEMGWDTYLVPYGKPMSAAVFALNFAARAAMTFGGIKPGSFDAARKILLYNKERVFAFVLALGADPGVNGTGQLLTDEKYATAAGAINFGFPVIADVNIPQILPRGICTYEQVVSGVPLDRIIQKAVEVRGLKLKLSKIPIPVPYGASFEGERVRKENLFVEFGGKYSTAFELLRARPMDEVEDGKIDLIGPDIDKAQEGEAMPLGVIVDVAGRNLKTDFEPVLERRIHHFISCINGVMHIGQRDIPWVRISKETYEKGFRLRHYGEVLIAKFKEDFGVLVDKVQVTVVTDQSKVEELLKGAREIYRQRDERVMGMKDEDVDKFYSCILCVPAGEEILLADGSFLPVEKLIEQAVESNGLQVLSWDGCSLSPRPVEELFINPAPAELLRITLKNGNALTLTPNHKVLVDRDGLEWVPARELKAGDGLLTAQTTYLKGAGSVGTEHPAKRTKLAAATFSGDRNHPSQADVLPRRCGQLLGQILAQANGRLQITKLPVDYKSLRAWISGRVRPSREKLRPVAKILKSQIASDLPALQELLGWCDSAVHVEKIKKLEHIRNTDRAVYNFSVPGTHNYMVNGVVVKNCQSYAPNHVCIVTPQRLGLCGAYTWLDCGASYEMDPHGPNKPVPKGICLDPVLGEWQGVNEYVRGASNGNLEKVSMYSIMQDPQTSCGCFECLVAVLPETNGVMIVNREFNGMTPIGMTFSTMAGEVGGGLQVPGFLGVGKLYITSEKFISADGGIKRLVWMPSELKEEIRERLEKRLAEIGMPELFDKIATEKDATTAEELLAFLQKVGHPALELEPIMS